METPPFDIDEAVREASRQSEEDQETCFVGYIPRFGLPARRERDCTHDCADHEACAQQRLRAYWLES